MKDVLLRDQRGRARRWLMIVSVALALCLIVRFVRAANPPDTVKLSTEGKYHLQALVAKQSALDSQLNALYVQFVNSNEQAKEIINREQAIVKERDALVEELFKAAALRKEDYQIDPDAGVFKKIQKGK